MANLIIGSGVAGLTAAYTLARRGAPVQVFEKEPFIGGASRTIQFGDFRFDLGGHRFYTRNEAVKGLLSELLGDEMIEVGRISRIYLNGRFINYPLTFSSAFHGLGLLKTASVTASYLLGRVHGKVRTVRTFEDWVLSRFGRGLYEFYFAPYSEKVWGVPCTELSADFAAQRIKGLSFREAVKNMLVRKLLRSGPPPSLITAFQYPRLGFGRIPDRLAEALPAGSLALDSPVIGVEHADGRVVALKVRTPDGAEQRVPADTVVSSMPISELVTRLEPRPPDAVLEAAAKLRYRDLVVLFLVANRPRISPDHWIYFPSRRISFGRIHEPKNWSADMAPKDRTGIVVEFFCFEGDDVWTADPADLVEAAGKGLEQCGLLRREDISEYCAVRLTRAYPIYTVGYAAQLQVLLDYLKPFENLYLVGRNGMFRYTSADYYIDMGLKAAENILGADHDLHAIGAAQEYAEK